jgi:PAS domain S-box-containing protein
LSPSGALDACAGRTRRWAWAEPVLPYLVTCFSVAVAVSLTFFIPTLKEKNSQILLVAAVVVSSYVGGIGPGLLAVLLSSAGWAMFVVPPERSLAIVPSEILRLVLFLGVAVLISSLHEQSKRAKEALLQQERRLQLALEAAQQAVWDYDLKRDEFWVSPEVRDIFGLGASDEFSPTYGGYMSFIHPDDRDLVVQAMTTSRENCVGYRIDYRIVRRDKSVRWVTARGRTFSNNHGRAERMIGVLVDVTDRPDIPQRMTSSVFFFPQPGNEVGHGVA